MASAAFFVNGSTAIRIANPDGASLRYRANTQRIAVDGEVPARAYQCAEATYFVESGVLEFMVGSATGYVPEGRVIRVPANTWHSWRNAGNQSATLLIRTVPNGTRERESDAHRPAARFLKIVAA